jgi:hypothetical protein
MGTIKEQSILTSAAAAEGRGDPTAPKAKMAVARKAVIFILTVGGSGFE